MKCRASNFGAFARLRVLTVLPMICLALSVRAAGVEIVETNGTLRVSIGGEPFTVYHYTNVPRPYFYPVLGPDETPMTRKWPLEPSTDEEHDHPHHRGLWYAHSSVNGLDFWTEETNSCKIVHDGFLRIQSGEKFGVIQSKDNWINHRGAVVCTDIRTTRIYNLPKDERMFDFDVTLQAPADKPVIFGDDKDGTIATRLPESMRLKHKSGPGEGHIVLSTGVRDDKTWGKHADWCYYYGPVDGGEKGRETLGVAIFDSPENPRHPTTWHVRDYGLFAANPFGLHFFEKKPPGAGDMTIPAGKSVTFRYRFYYHHGDEIEARVAEQYQKYVNEKRAE